MTSYLSGNPSVGADMGKITPDHVNPQLLKDVSTIIEPVISSAIPEKRSGFKNVAYVMFQVCIQLLMLSPAKTAEWMEGLCQEQNVSFQSYKTRTFANNKKRRYFPDQPSLSRYHKRLKKLECAEEFWNLVLLGHFLYLRSIEMIRSEIKIIADYTEEPCKKNPEDPYCFGKKEGKTVHKTLTFSAIAGELHQVLANFKIKKRQNKLPLFEDMVDTLSLHGFTIVQAILDRGFYRKRLLRYFKSKGIGVIMPGRKCAQTAKKIRKYLKGAGTRYCKGFIKLKYVKGFGYPKVHFDLLLAAKRKHTLGKIKNALRKGKITQKEAEKRIFPLIVMFGNNGGVTKLQGNESYIRNLYRRRWLIEIAFREMNRLGLVNKSQNRDLRLATMGAKSLLYNIWQVQRHLLKKEDPSDDELDLNEFLGRCYRRRYPRYIGLE